MAKKAIVIMNDSFRRDHLGCYGNPWIHTPHLDRFAEHAATFEQCYIGSYPTVPNRWDIATGRFGFTHRGWQPLGPDDVTVAQILAQNGVHTQIIWDTPMLAQHDYNYTKGFRGVEFVRGQKGDSWITDPTLPIRQPAQPHKTKSAASMASYLRNHYGRKFEREYCVGRTISAAMDWLETNYRHESFFLYIDMWDPHEPFDCPWYDYARYADPCYCGDQMQYPQYGRPTYMTPSELANAKALYAGLVTLVDRWVGQLLDLVERLGLMKDTMVLWTTDHGHLFGEHDLQGKPGAELGKLYEVTTRIPLLVHHPEGLGAGKKVQGIVQPADILPSVLEFMDVPVPDAVQGKSFWPLVSSGGGMIHEYAFSSRFPPSAGSPAYVAAEGAVFDGWVGSDRIVEPSTVTDGRWSLLCAPQGMPSELYDLVADPEQRHNVISGHPGVASHLREAWISFLKEHGAAEARIRPFIEGRVDVHTPTSAKLHAFRDDQGQWIAFPTEREALASAFRDDAPGSARQVAEVTFGQVLDDNPKNLVYLNAQYYWAEDLA